MKKKRIMVSTVCVVLFVGLLLTGVSRIHADDSSQDRNNATPATHFQNSPDETDSTFSKRGATAAEEQESERPTIQISHPGKGIQFQSSDERYRLHFSLRGQFRFSTPFDSDPRSTGAFETADRSSIDVRRARLKFDGNAYRKWLKYYLEYDVADNRMLDMRMTLSKYPWLQVRAGQFKVYYNRERVDSSGKQQFAERSIVNREFTVDRQMGVMAFGRLWSGKPSDSWYHVGVFNGTGRLGLNDDSEMMWMGRYQWNFLGRDLAFAQGDVEFHEKPTGSIAFGGVRNRSAFTRFSSSGGGQLDGFDSGDAGRYELTQFMEETAFKYRGFSFQQEFHWKEIEDHVTNATTELRGNYLQAGYFLGRLSEALPDTLEAAFRYAWVDPDITVSSDRREEYTFGLNWFFAKHDNKLTFDVSRLSLQQPVVSSLEDVRARIQWDISF